MEKSQCCMPYMIFLKRDSDFFLINNVDEITKSKAFKFVTVLIETRFCVLIVIDSNRNGGGVKGKNKFKSY